MMKFTEWASDDAKKAFRQSYCKMMLSASIMLEDLRTEDKVSPQWLADYRDAHDTMVGIWGQYTAESGNDDKHELDNAVHDLGLDDMYWSSSDILFDEFYKQ